MSIPCCGSLKFLSLNTLQEKKTTSVIELNKDGLHSVGWSPNLKEKKTSVIELNKDGLHSIGWSPNLSLNQRIREKVPCHHSQFCFLTERSYCSGQQWIPSPHHDMITCQSSTQHNNNELEYKYSIRLLRLRGW